VNYLLSPFTVVLSGNLIPLALFPDWMQRVLFLQPFAGVVDIPFRIYSGNLEGGAAWAGLGLQAGWTLLLVVGGRVWMRRVMQRLDVQGG
jgi:ABC-2 type transport system permease protein